MKFVIVFCGNVDLEYYPVECMDMHAGEEDICIQ